MSAINRLKDLHEKRGAKLSAASTIVNQARAEKRELTADENQKVTTIHAEVESIDGTIHTEIRQASFESAAAPKLSKGEERTVNGFDFSKVLNHMNCVARGTASVLEGVELEMTQEGLREARASGISAPGVVLPRVLVRRGGNQPAERRDMTATGTTTTTLDQGGMTIATAKTGLLDDFFNASVLRQAGCTVLENLVGNLDIPRLTAGTAPAKKAENAAADEVTPLTAMLSLSPKRLPAYIDISEQLLRQSSSAIEAVLRTHLVNQMTAVQEASFFHGGGTSEPTGIAATSGIGSVAGGTNGLAPTLAHLIALETAVDSTNALLGNLRYISNGQIRGKLKSTAINATYGDRMILGDNGLLNGYQPLFSNAVSRTLTKGNQSLSSAIFFGNFADFYAAYWGGISLEMVRDKTNAIGGLYTLVASAYYDGGVVRPKSFAAMLDALGA